MATRDFPHHFEGNFPEFKERQLLFALTRQLADAQFVRGDRLRTERLWQEAAAEEMDPERIIALLYGVDDHADAAAMDMVDRPFREQRRRSNRQARSPFGRFARFAQRRPGAGHRRGVTPGSQPAAGGTLPTVGGGSSAR
ncbi:MAG: hypothetical protein ACK55R_03735 [Cyanobacteriota bacterium]|jgi:hypothetical protein